MQQVFLADGHENGRSDDERAGSGTDEAVAVGGAHGGFSLPTAAWPRAGGSVGPGKALYDDPVVTTVCEQRGPLDARRLRPPRIDHASRGGSHATESRVAGELPIPKSVLAPLCQLGVHAGLDYRSRTRVRASSTRCSSSAFRNQSAR